MRASEWTREKDRIWDRKKERRDKRSITESERARKREMDTSRTIHNGRSSGRLKCAGTVASCAGEWLALKLKLHTKTLKEENGRWRSEEERWRRRRGRTRFLACNLKASRCISVGPRESISRGRARLPLKTIMFFFFLFFCPVTRSSRITFNYFYSNQIELEGTIDPDTVSRITFSFDIVTTLGLFYLEIKNKFSKYLNKYYVFQTKSHTFQRIYISFFFCHETWLGYNSVLFWIETKLYFVM